MRIISVFTALRIILVLILSQTALASESAQANETKTNLKIQYNIITSEGIMKNGNKITLVSNLNKFEGFIPAKTEEKSDREKALMKYKKKGKSVILPEGKFKANISAYTAAADECGKSDGITASGLSVKENETIACPSQFPLGTKIEIEGMGTYICQDRGGAIKGNKIDIYMETKKEAFEFGRQKLLAEVVE